MNGAKKLAIRHWQQDLAFRQKFWQKFWARHGIEHGKYLLSKMDQDPCSREMNQMTHELKVKALSLQAENHTIKQEEARQLRLQRRYIASQYRARRLAAAAATLENEDDKHRAMIDADNRDNYAIVTYRSLRDHRLQVVKPVARATNVARGFLFGHDYTKIETYPKDVGNRTVEYLTARRPANGKEWVGPDWDKVTAMVEKYGKEEDVKRYPAWLAAIGLSLDIEGKVVAS